MDSKRQTACATCKLFTPNLGFLLVAVRCRTLAWTCSGCFSGVFGSSSDIHSQRRCERALLSCSEAVLTFVACHPMPWNAIDLDIIIHHHFIADIFSRCSTKISGTRELNWTDEPRPRKGHLSCNVHKRLLDTKIAGSGFSPTKSRKFCHKRSLRWKHYMLCEWALVSTTFFTKCWRLQVFSFFGLRFWFIQHERMRKKQNSIATTGALHVFSSM